MRLFHYPLSLAADKPCKFLLSSKDDGENPDAGYLGRGGGGWVALAAVLVTTALALYGRTICRDSPLLIGGTEKQEEPSPSPAVIGQKPKEENVIGQKQKEENVVGQKQTEENVIGRKRKEENRTHAVVGGALVESASEESVEHAVSGVPVENVPEAPVERVSTGGAGVEGVSAGGVGEGEADNGEITAGDIAEGVVNGDLSNIEANDVKISCQEVVTVDNSFGGQEVSTDKAVMDSEDTPTAEVMTSDVSSEGVRDVEVDGIEECGLASDEAQTQGKNMCGKLVVDRDYGNQAMQDGETGDRETPANGGVRAGEGGSEQESSGEIGDEVATNGCVPAVGRVSGEEVAGWKTDGYR